VNKKFLVHAKSDYVGVAVADIAAGETVNGSFMDSGGEVELKSTNDIPLGHKIALRNIRKGEKVVEYNETIGAATMDIQPGEHVHTHNLKTLRWA
jgi:(2R)-sulfolactate sulfo-lyase subunit alpha